jgi:addiction module RelE/StbE family toxin
MRTLIWTNTFLRALRKVTKRQQQRRQEIETALRLLTADPFAPQLETHKLKGKLSGSWACSVSRDLRIIFDFVKDKEGKDAILLLEIGTHDEVY